MRLRIFSVFDVKAKAYLPPFFMSEQGQARRSFSDAVADRQHQFARHPEDYTLLCIGDFDDATAKITSFAAPELVCTALECVKPNEQPQLFDKGQA